MTAEQPKGKNALAWQIFLGLFLFFVVLPIATCAGCMTCAGTTAVIGAASSGSSSSKSSSSRNATEEAELIADIPDPKTPLQKCLSVEAQSGDGIAAGRKCAAKNRDEILDRCRHPPVDLCAGMKRPFDFCDSMNAAMRDACPSLIAR